MTWPFVNRGAVAGSNTDEANERVDLLKDEIARLDAYEKTIDQHKQWCMQGRNSIDILDLGTFWGAIFWAGSMDIPAVSYIFPRLANDRRPGQFRDSEIIIDFKIQVSVVL